MSAPIAINSMGREPATVRIATFEGEPDEPAPGTGEPIDRGAGVPA